MRRLTKWIIAIIGRWQAKRIRTKELRDRYRKYDDNARKLEKGEWL
jgi:hypothetical protein